MGVAPREVRGPDGKTWQVRVYRFRAPGWRPFGGAVAEDPSVSIFLPVDLVVGVLDVVDQDQVARQLELGYDRVQPHNAEFEGFGEA